jgi:hypothetical protein
MARQMAVTADINGPLGKFDHAAPCPPGLLASGWVPSDESDK